MLLFKIVLQFLAVGIALSVNILDYVNHDRRTSNFKLWRKLLFIFSIIFLIGSITLTYFDTVESSQKEEKLMKEVGQLQKSLDEQKQYSEKLSDDLNAQLTLVNTSPHFDLKWKAITLYKDILQFVAERKSKEPSIDADIRLNKLEWNKQFHERSIYSSQTQTEFTKKFGIRWETTVAEMKQRGVTSPYLRERAYQMNVNLLTIEQTASLLAKLAVQMPEPK